jgi:hypothetical protein
MAFILVVIPKDETGPKKVTWGAFFRNAKIESLESEEGVFSTGDTAWLFDTSKSLQAFTRVVHHAVLEGLQVFTFELSGDPLRPRIGCVPPAPPKKLLDLIAA